MTIAFPTSTLESQVAMDRLFGDVPLRDFPFRDVASAHGALQRLRELPIPGDLLDHLERTLAEQIVALPNPDQCLIAASQFIAAARSPHSLCSLFERDPDSLTGLLRMLAFSHWLAQALIADPEAFDLIRITEGQPVDRAILVDEIAAECALATSASHVETILRRHRRRELLRIAYGDLVGNQPLARTCEQLTFLADAILSAALQSARNLLLQKRGERAGHDAISVRMSVLACDHYGGSELDYRHDLDVLLIYDTWGDAQRSAANRESESSMEFASAWADLFSNILAATDSLGPIYLLHQKLRPTTPTVQPNAVSESRVTDAREVIRFFEISGRTWQRQALTKSRIAAGDQSLGEQFQKLLYPWIYRRYLGTADWDGIQSLKRKLARIGTAENDAAQRLALVQQTTHDIEHVTQFLQLLNGSELPSLRVSNTLVALTALEQSGCLTLQEQTLLAEHYVTLRRLQLRLQLASRDLQDPEAWGTAALSMGYQDASGNPDPQSLTSDCMQRRQVCRRIIEHLVHEVFGEANEIPFETEMVLDPDVSLEAVSSVLKGYGFSDPAHAFEKLLSMACESVRFLSDRRARHFLAGIAPRLLEEMAATPYPDETLARLADVSDSIGGKAALWELFQTTPSTLRLCVRLCASSPYLTGILTSNPGMLDELLDSLVLDRLPLAEELEKNARELCRFAEDIDPILHSFKNSAHLRIGVRDILGRDCIEATHRSLADTAETCLRRLAEDELEHLSNRYGDPLDSSGDVCSLTMVALGKLGAREPNYHSDLDILFLYESEGQTRPRAGGRRDGTTNHHFFNELTQRIAKRVNHFGPSGRLYELDARIRFSNHRGTLAVTIEQFREHFASSHCELWQRLALVNARIIFGSLASTRATEEVIRNSLLHPAWHPHFVNQAKQLRYALQQGASEENLKRAPGGTMDIESIVQLMLLQHAAELDGYLGLGTLEGLELLRLREWISIEAAQHLAASYRYLRTVESNLRLMNLPARHDLPQSPDELRWLAYSLRETHWSVVVQKCHAYREINRQLFETIFSETSPGR